MLNNGTMTKRVKHRVLTIMRLALEYNDSMTSCSETGDKPTFFVDFDGSICALDVTVFTRGYENDPEHINDLIHLTVCDGRTEEQILSVLDDWVQRFNRYYKDWWSQLSDI